HHLREAYGRIFPDLDAEVEVGYESSVSQVGDLDVASLGREALYHGVLERFRMQLDRVRVRECERRSSLLGPHLDDIRFSFAGRPFKHVASQGQTRALVLALKIAEIMEIRERLQTHPLLILDDVAGELDPRHAGYFFSFLEETQGQVLLSVTSRDSLPMLEHVEQSSFSVRAGEVTPVSLE
ncbi:MAG: hypothetical protein AAGJ35_08890, partial [Myxococcota bacterium]